MSDYKALDVVKHTGLAKVYEARTLLYDNYPYQAREHPRNEPYAWVFQNVAARVDMNLSQCRLYRIFISRLWLADFISFTL